MATTQRPDPGRIRIGDGSRRHSRSSNPEQGEIGAPITREEASFQAATVDQAHGHDRSTRDVRVGDHTSPRPEHPGAQRLAPVHDLDGHSTETIREVGQLDHRASGATWALADGDPNVPRLAAPKHGHGHVFAHVIGS